ISHYPPAMPDFAGFPISRRYFPSPSSPHGRTTHGRLGRSAGRAAPLSAIVAAQSDHSTVTESDRVTPSRAITAPVTRARSRRWSVPSAITTPVKLTSPASSNAPTPSRTPCPTPPPARVPAPALMTGNHPAQGPPAGSGSPQLPGLPRSQLPPVSAGPGQG